MTLMDECMMKCALVDKQRLSVDRYFQMVNFCIGVRQLQLDDKGTAGFGDRDLQTTYLCRRVRQIHLED